MPAGQEGTTLPALPMACQSVDEAWAPGLGSQHGALLREMYKTAQEMRGWEFRQGPPQSRGCCWHLSPGHGLSSQSPAPLTPFALPAAGAAGQLQPGEVPQGAARAG